MMCQREEREAGRAYPRTCPTCKLGPCRKFGVKPRQSLAAAQADYEARIIAAIHPDTEALERATDAAYTEGFEHGERSDLRVENERMREALTLLATCTPRVDISADEFLREFVHPTARAALQPEVSHDWTAQECIAFVREVRR